MFIPKRSNKGNYWSREFEGSVQGTWDDSSDTSLQTFSEYLLRNIAAPCSPPWLSLALSHTIHSEANECFISSVQIKWGHPDKHRHSITSHSASLQIYKEV